MHIGIIYYSLTGTTEEFANRIANGLIKEKHHVEVVKIKTNIEVKGPGQKFEIQNNPDCSRFDFILFGGPVWAFSACPVVLQFIKQSIGLTGKKIIPFVTMGFPFKSLGGNNAINQINKAAKTVGAEVISGVIIPKLFHDYKKLMDKAVLEIVSKIRNP
ncbi:MAG: flavodoxin domain-containing protein [candidate division WOR-3 bacterium]